MRKAFSILLLLACGTAVAAPALSRFTIGVNEAGYEPDAPKWCVVTNPPALDYVIQTIGTNIHWRTVWRGRFIPSGKNDGICYGDFSTLTEPGDYRILCGDEAFNVGCAMGGLPDDFKGVASFHFIVKDGVYDTLERMLLTYITWQRCGHRKGWAGLCHQDPVPVKDAEGRVVRTIDACGGYHQSNDLRCWHDGISMSLYSLLRYAELRRPLWDDGDIAAELRWGCDYFLKVIAPEGYVYDAQFAPIGWGPFDYYLAPATLGAQCNIVMLLARASRYFKEDGDYAERLLAAAKRIDAQIETNPFFAEKRPAPTKNLPAGAQPAERCYYQQWRTSANGLAERCGAADSTALLHHLEIADKALQSCRDELRNCLWDLKNRALEEKDMNEAIRRTVSPFVGDVVLLIRFNVPRDQISDNTAHALMRIVRELAANAVRHGRARTIRVAGSLDGDALMLSVQDDGCGFDPENRPDISTGHFGIQGVIERIERLEGTYAIESSPGHGATVSINDLKIDL